MKIGERIGLGTFNPIRPEDPADRVAAVTDLNNDWKIDLLFQKPNGGPINVWSMNGLNRINSAPLSIQPSGSWRLVGP